MVTNRRVVEQSKTFYKTEPWAVRALLEVEEFSGTIAEPACGDGVIAEEVVAKYGACDASDLFDRGYGTTGVDFLAPTYWKQVDNIITNPPYGRNPATGGRLEEEFVRKACLMANNKVAMFLRLSFLAGQRRHKDIFSANWPHRVHVFSERCTLYPGDYEAAEEDRNGGTTEYAWFVFDYTTLRDMQHYRTVPSAPEIRWIGPGTKARLSTSKPEGIAA